MEKKLINRILIFSSLIMVTLIGVFVYCYLNPRNENLGCGTKDVAGFCGTKLASPEKQKGKEIFNSNCAACHIMNEKTAPDLIKNVFKRMPSEKYFGRFITNEDSLRKANDKYAKNLMEKFPNGYKNGFANGFVHNFKFSKEEIESLKKYIE